MALYILSDPPEIRHLPWRERERILEAARRRASSMGTFGRGLLAGSAFCLMLVQLTFSLLNFFLIDRTPWQYGVFACSLGLVVIVLMVVLLIRNARILRRAVVAVLIDNGLRSTNCPSCGCDLAASTGETCPRCHTALTAPHAPGSGQPTPSA